MMMNSLGVSPSQPHTVEGVTPGSSNLTYISILPSNNGGISDINAVQQFAAAPSNQITQPAQSSPIPGHALAHPSPNAAFPEPITVQHVGGATVTIAVPETAKGNQSVQHPMLDLTNVNTHSTGHECSSSGGLENLVSKANDIQTVFMKQVNINGENKTIFVDSTGGQVVLPQGVQVLDLPQTTTIEDNNSLLSPHNIGPTEAPFYVNAKQYNRILKRREARAKLEAKGKITKGRSKFLYNSRHAHAAKRVRGPGGKFLKRAELEKQNTFSVGVDFPERDTKIFQTITLQYSS